MLNNVFSQLENPVSPPLKAIDPKICRSIKCVGSKTLDATGQVSRMSGTIIYRGKINIFSEILEISNFNVRSLLDIFDL